MLLGRLARKDPKAYEAILLKMDGLTLDEIARRVRPRVSRERVRDATQRIEWFRTEGE